MPFTLLIPRLPYINTPLVTYTLPNFGCSHLLMHERPSDKSNHSKLKGGRITTVENTITITYHA